MFVLAFAFDVASKSNRHKPNISESIFQRIALGDKEAFEELYIKTNKILYSYLLSLCKNSDLASDLLSDTYVKIRSAAHLYNSMGKPLAWMFVIAKRLYLSHMRKHTPISEAEISEEKMATFSEIENAVLRIVLEDVMNALESTERQIVLLHVSGGLLHREIAKDLGMPLATVLSKYNRALVKLRKKLTREGIKY